MARCSRKGGSGMRMPAIISIRTESTEDFAVMDIDAMVEALTEMEKEVASIQSI